MTSRRSFFKQLAIGAAAFSILPSASTYSRIWKPKAIVPVRYEINPAWVNATYEVSFYWNSEHVRDKQGLVLRRNPGQLPLSPEPFPVRFIRDGEKWETVPSFIEVTV